MAPIPQIPFNNWLESDRAAWNLLFKHGDILDGQGPACHWAEPTRKTNRKHYSQWLGWLLEKDLLEDESTESAVTPWVRATPKRVRAYAQDLMIGRSPRTVASAIIGLKCVVIKMEPDVDWRWLRDLTNRLDNWAKPSRKIPEASLPAPDMFRLALDDLEKLAEPSQHRPTERLAFRDTLMIALLIACPIRLRNMGMIRIGTHLVQTNREWHLRFDGTETKTGQDLSLVVPSQLKPWLDHYLNHVRPLFPRVEATDRLWPGSKKTPLADISIYQRIRSRSRHLFGVTICPHAFRSIAATFLADSSPSDALFARPLLGHRQLATTEKHYIRATQIEASHKVANALQEIRDSRELESLYSASVTPQRRGLHNADRDTALVRYSSGKKFHAMPI